MSDNPKPLTGAEIAEVRKDYTPSPAPVCYICGATMMPIERGIGYTTYRCRQNDPDGGHYAPGVARGDQRVIDVLATVDRLVEVVRWYEDKAHHKEKHVYQGRTIVASLTSEIEQDQGQRARDLLKEMELL